MGLVVAGIGRDRGIRYYIFGGDAVLEFDFSVIR